MEYDELLTKYLGEFGLYQRVVLLTICITGMTLAFNVMSTAFILGVPDHWCANEDLDHLDISTDARLNVSIPMEEVGGELVYSSCKMYDRNYTNWTLWDVQHALSNFNNETPIVGCRDGWIYDQSMFTSTAVSDFDMVCDGRYFQATATSVYMAGMMVGVILTGAISDQIGRKLTMSICVVVMVVCKIIVAFSQNVIVFMIFRFIVAMAGIGQYTCAFVMGIEIVGPSWRPHVGAILQYFWVFGYILVPAIAYGIRDWRHINLIISVPFVLLFGFFFIPESPRWLYITKKSDRADKVVKLMAKINKRELPEKLHISIKKLKKAYVWDIMRTPRMRLRSINVFFNWFVVSFVYYGLSLNTSYLVGNMYLNFFLLGVVEIPAYIFCQIAPSFLGRRLSLVATLFLAGVSLLLTIAVPDDYTLPIVTLSMIGKFGIAAAFVIVYVFTAELYPTPVRNVSVGAGSFFARFGGIVAPYVTQLSYYGRSIPILIYGVMSILAGLLALLLPETKGQNLPETMEDGENFGRKSKIQEKHCNDSAENCVDTEQKKELCQDNTNNSNAAVINSVVMDNYEKSFQTEL